MSMDRRRPAPPPGRSSSSQRFEIDKERLQQDIRDRIVSEGRRRPAGARALAASRPVTPQDRSRGLFGVSSGAAQYGNTGSERPGSARVRATAARPPSAFPMGRKQFLQNLPGTYDDPEYTTSPSGSRPASVVPTRTIRLTPLAPSGTGASSTGSALNPRRNTDPPKLIDSGGERVRRQASWPRGEGEQADTAVVRPRPPQTKPPRGSDPGADSRPNPPSTPLSERSQTAPRTPRPPSASRPPPRAKSRSSSATQVRVTTANAADNEQWEEISAIIATLDPELANLEQLRKSCDTLRLALDRRPLRSKQRRGAVLRSLIRLLDLKDCRVRLKVARSIVLLTNQAQTLTNVCMLLFSESREPENDAVVHDEQIATVLIAVLRLAKWGEDERTIQEEYTQALVYCCGAIKNVASSAVGQQAFVECRSIAAFAEVLHRIAVAPPPRRDGDNLHMQTVNLLVQMLAALRNLAALPDHRTEFVSTGIITDLCVLLDVYCNEHEFMLNMSRVFSKLSIQSECRTALARIDGIMRQLMKVVIMHQRNKPLTHRLLFTLGNMTANDSESRTELFLASSRCGDLLSLLATLTTTGPASGEASGKAGHAAAVEHDNVLTKLVRVVANLCINPDIGAEIACSDKLLVLVDLLRQKRVDVSEDLVLHIVGAINNLSFYRMEGNVILGAQEEIAKLVVPLLRHDSLEVMIETARVFGNLSQEKSIRELLHSTRADELMVVLLDHENREVVYTVCGVLMNMMGDDEGRGVLKTAGGVRSLIEVLVEDGQSDWQLAGMVCKTLWNFSEGYIEQAVSVSETFGEQEGEELLVVLGKYVDLDADTEFGGDQEREQLWRTEFFDVGQHLLNRVQSMSSALVAIDGPANVCS